MPLMQYYVHPFTASNYSTDHTILTILSRVPLKENNKPYTKATNFECDFHCLTTTKMVGDTIFNTGNCGQVWLTTQHVKCYGMIQSLTNAGPFCTSTVQWSIVIYWCRKVSVGEDVT